MDWKTAATLLAVAPFLALAIAFLAVETAAIIEELTARPHRTAAPAETLANRHRL